MIASFVPKATKKSSTSGSKIKRQTGKLVKTLMEANPHYVRCVRAWCSVVFDITSLLFISDTNTPTHTNRYDASNQTTRNARTTSIKAESSFSASIWVFWRTSKYEELDLRIVLSFIVFMNVSNYSPPRLILVHFEVPIEMPAMPLFETANLRFRSCPMRLSLERVRSLSRDR